MVVGCPLSVTNCDQVQSETISQTRQDQERGMNGTASLLHSWHWVLYLANFILCTINQGFLCCIIWFQSADIHSMCPARQIFGLALPCPAHEKKTFLTLPCRMVILVSITYSRPEIGSILDLLERFLKSKVHSLYCWGAMMGQQMFCW